MDSYIYHFALAHSGFEHAEIVLGGESFVAPPHGLRGWELRLSHFCVFSGELPIEIGANAGFRPSPQAPPTGENGTVHLPRRLPVDRSGPTIGLNRCERTGRWMRVPSPGKQSGAIWPS